MDEKTRAEIEKHMPSAEDLRTADEAGAKVLMLSRAYTEENKKIYVYLAVPPSKVIPFKEAEEKGNFYYEDFGEILATGEGHEPPEEVKKRMEEEYGFNHDFEKEVIEKATEIQKKEDLKAKYSGKKSNKEE